jgi:hypothetical protein
MASVLTTPAATLVLTKFNPEMSHQIPNQS